MKNLTFFLIDDDEDDRDVFAIALKRFDQPSTLLTAHNGKVALEKLSAEQHITPDYIFLDLNMPAMHGTACLALLKKLPHLNDVPIIMYSTSSNPVYEEETQKLGASHYLIKPSEINELTRIISLLASGQQLPFSLKAGQQ